MKIFLTWSGEYSKRVAAAWRAWLPLVIQSAEPFMSEDDIDKGSKWFHEISKTLSDSNFGVVFLTPDNLDAPWIHFEAGALSKYLDESHVVPFLVEVRTDSVVGPLSQFQKTSFEKEDVRRLIGAINSASSDGQVTETVLTHTFETFWGELDTKIVGVVSDIRADKGARKPPQRPQREVLEELLELSRVQTRLLSTPRGWDVPRHLEYDEMEVDQLMQGLVRELAKVGKWGLIDIGPDDVITIELEPPEYMVGDPDFDEHTAPSLRRTRALAAKYGYRIRFTAFGRREVAPDVDTRSKRKPDPGGSAP